MYAIIYWVDGDEVYPYLTDPLDKQIKLFENLEETRKYVDEIENTDEDIEARVISIEDVRD